MDGTFQWWLLVATPCQIVAISASVEAGRLHLGGCCTHLTYLTCEGGDTESVQVFIDL